MILLPWVPVAILANGEVAITEGKRPGRTLWNIVLFVDLPGFYNPSIVTGDSLRPDLIIKSYSGSLYLLEIIVGFESNLENNFKRKYAKYVHLVTELRNSFKNV